MKVAVMVSLVEAIPIGVLIASVHACPLSRRPRFWLRFAGVLFAFLLPDLVIIFAQLGEEAAGRLLVLGFIWGIVLIGPARFVLFHGWDSGAGPGEDDGEGPGPGEGRPTPPAPIGGIPLPDAEPSLRRVRDHRPPRRAPRPRRPARERERLPSRLWP
jgi:hypothetical protein